MLVSIHIVIDYKFLSLYYLLAQRLGVSEW